LVLTLVLVVVLGVLVLGAGARGGGAWASPSAEDWDIELAVLCRRVSFARRRFLNSPIAIDAFHRRWSLRRLASSLEEKGLVECGDVGNLFCGVRGRRKVLLSMQGAIFRIRAVLCDVPNQIRCADCLLIWQLRLILASQDLFTFAWMRIVTNWMKK